MKKCLFLLLSIFFVSCTSVKASRDKLDYNANYIDKSFTHTITVIRSDSLSEFGITSEEWKNYFDNSIIYKASGAGNGFMSKTDVKKYTYDAIKISIKNRRRKYGAIINEQDDTSYSSYNSSLIENHDYSCSVVMFDNEDLIPILREAFGKIQVITVQ